MRRLLLLFFSFLFINVIYAKPIEISKLRFNKNQIVFDVKGQEMPETKIDYDEDNRMIFVEFSNSVSSKEIKEMFELNGTYIKDIMKYQYDDKIDFFITVKNGVKFKEIKLQNPTRFVLNFETKKSYTIVIDPGHGGKDPGARANKLSEKDIVFKVSKLLKEELDKDFNVVLTRDKDVFIPLDDRPKVGNDINADLFISIHVNAASRRRSARGVEVFYFSQSSSAYAKKIAEYENSFDEKHGVKTKYTELIVDDIFYRINQEKSIKLSDKVLRELNIKTKFPKRKTHGANFAVLRGSKSPAILVELGFLTNKTEAGHMKKSWYQTQMAKAIAESVREYFK